MTRRPKLSLESDRQLRQEPPRRFSHARQPDGGSAATPGPSTSAGTGASTTAPPPAAAEPPPAPQGFGLDRAALIKILLAAGVAAVTIFLLKRRL
jgi:hypothetical protein